VGRYFVGADRSTTQLLLGVLRKMLFLHVIHTKAREPNADGAHQDDHEKGSPPRMKQDFFRGEKRKSYSGQKESNKPGVGNELRKISPPCTYAMYTRLDQPFKYSINTPA
jgi:hypothetical protein